MPHVKVKICGITNWPDAQRAVQAGADFLGFNFYPESPRYILPARARKIVERLPKHVSAVGIFVNEDEETMLKIAQTVGLGYLQLHGSESPSAVARLRRSFPVIKAVRVKRPFRRSQLSRFKDASAILLDSSDGAHWGGTGKTFDWKFAKRTSARPRIFLAGGLTPANVAQAIRATKPYAVDVCSGVEAKPGKKGAALIKAFLHAANGAARKTPSRRLNPVEKSKR